MEKLVDKFKNKIKINKKMTVFLISLMLIGVIIGSLFIIIINDSDKTLLKSYLNEFINNSSNNSLNYLTALKNGLITNLGYIIIIWLLGISIIGIPIIIFMFFIKSFTLGFSIATIIYNFKAKGCLLSLAYIFPHQLLNFIAYLLITIYSLSFSFKLIYSVFKKKNINFKTIMNKYLFILTISLILTLIATLFEVFITPELIKIVIPIIN